MLKLLFLAFCLAQLSFLAGYWLRVTVRDQNASSLSRMKSGLDWQGSGRGRRKKSVRTFFGLRRH